MAKKATAKKKPAKKTTVKKAAPGKKVPAKKTPAQKTDTKKSAPKASAAKPSVKKAAPVKKASPASKPAAFVPDAIAATRPVKVKRKAAKPQPKAKVQTKSKPANNAASTEAVDGYLSTLNDWRKDAVARLRTMIQQAVPHADEKVEDSQSVYEHHGPFAWIKAHAKSVNLGFLRGVELPDPRKLLEGTRGTVRHINLRSLKDAGKKELEELVKLASKLNEVRHGESNTKRETKSPRKKAAKHK